MTHLYLSPSDREQLAAEIGVIESDVTPETILGYAEELKEGGRMSDAARVISYFGPEYAETDADETDSPSEVQWRAFETALGLGDGSEERQYADDSAEADVFERFRPFLGLPTENE